MKKNIILVILSTVLSLNLAFAFPDPDNGIKIFKREFNFSISTGPKLFGARQSFEKGMDEAGFGDGVQGFTFSKRTYEFPYSNRYPNLDLEATCFFKENKGISLNLGLAEFIGVNGRDDFNAQGMNATNSLSLLSMIYSASLNYVYRPENKRHNWFVGPSFILHNVSDRGARDNHSQMNKKLGLFTGYSYQIIQRKHVFWSLKTNIRWATKSSVGPFYAHVAPAAQYEDEPQYFTSEFTATVNLITMNVGLALGFR
jgi:hypothetical protein